VLASVFAIRLQAHRPFATVTITQIMRHLRRDHDVEPVLTAHVHLPFLAMEGFLRESAHLELSANVVSV
jgi:hypothetical protein